MDHCACPTCKCMPEHCTHLSRGPGAGSPAFLVACSPKHVAQAPRLCMGQAQAKAAQMPWWRSSGRELCLLSPETAVSIQESPYRTACKTSAPWLLQVDNVWHGLPAAPEVCHACLTPLSNTATLHASSAPAP